MMAEDPDAKRKRIKSVVGDICKRLEDGSTASSEDVDFVVGSLQDSWSEIRKDCEKALRNSAILFNCVSANTIFDYIQQSMAVAKQWQSIHGLVLGTGAMASAMLHWEKISGESSCRDARLLCLSFMDSSNVPVREAVRKAIELLQCSASPEHIADLLRRLGPISLQKKLSPFYVDGLLCCLEDVLKVSTLSFLEGGSGSNTNSDVTVSLMDVVTCVEKYLDHESSTVRQVACRVYFAVLQRLVLCSCSTQEEEVVAPLSTSDAVAHMCSWICGVFEVASVPSDSDTDSGGADWHELECCLLISERLLHQLVYDFSFGSSGPDRVIGFSVMEKIGVHLRAGYYQLVLHPQFEIRRMASQMLPLFARYSAINIRSAPAGCLFAGICPTSSASDVDDGSILKCQYLVACRWLIEKCKLVQMVTEALAVSPIAGAQNVSVGLVSLINSSADEIDLTTESERDTTSGDVEEVVTVQCPVAWTIGLQGRLQEEEGNIQLRQLLAYMANSSPATYSQLIDVWKSNVWEIVPEIQHFFDYIFPLFEHKDIISMDVLEAVMIGNAWLESVIPNNSALSADGLCDSDKLAASNSTALTSAIQMMSRYQQHNLDEASGAAPKLTVLSSIQAVTEEWSGPVTSSGGNSASFYNNAAYLELSTPDKYQTMMNTLVIKKATGDSAHRQLCSSICTTLPCCASAVALRMTLPQALEFLLVQATWIYHVMTNSLWLDRKLIARKCLLDFFIESSELLKGTLTDRLNPTPATGGKSAAEFLVRLLVKMTATLDALCAVYTKKSASKQPNIAAEKALRDNIDNMEKLFYGCANVLQLSFEMWEEFTSHKSKSGGFEADCLCDHPCASLLRLPDGAFCGALGGLQTGLRSFDFQQSADLPPAASTMDHPTSVFSFQGGGAADASTVTNDADADEDEFSDWDDDEFDDASPVKGIPSQITGGLGAPSPRQSPVSSPFKEKFPHCSSKTEMLNELQGTMLGTIDYLLKQV